MRAKLEISYALSLWAEVTFCSTAYSPECSTVIMADILIASLSVVADTIHFVTLGLLYSSDNISQAELS
jgi:hypothetical protein